MRFSWSGLLVAPMLAPAIFSAAMTALFSDSLLGFIILFVPACIVSYGATIFMLLPSLFLFSVWWPLTVLRVCLLGLGLGALSFVPATFWAWLATGPDSGPPTESFFSFFARWIADPLTAIYPLAGLMTAGAYWWLGSRRQDREGN